MDSPAEASSQTKICCFMDGPMAHRAFTDTRLSSPVRVQVMQIMSDPRSRTTISEKYLLMTTLFGTRANQALMTMGSSEVTEMETGRKIHHAAIQTAVARAVAPLKPKDSRSSTTVRANNTGPDSNAAVLLFIKTPPSLFLCTFIIPPYIIEIKLL